MKNLMREKIILVDCDGVLLDWKFAFQTWMETHHNLTCNDSDQYEIAGSYDMSVEDFESYVIEFNNSAAIGFLPPLRDAVYYLKRLHERHGFQFHCITALSNHRHPQMLREKNLEYLFGKNIFTKFIYQDTGRSKLKDLAEYSDTKCFWIEDKIENAMDGLKVGLDPIIIAHDYNNDLDVTDGIPRLWKWKHIYNYILNEIGEE